MLQNLDNSRLCHMGPVRDIRGSVSQTRSRSLPLVAHQERVRRRRTTRMVGLLGHTKNPTIHPVRLWRTGFLVGHQRPSVPPTSVTLSDRGERSICCSRPLTLAPHHPIFPSRGT